MKTISYCTALYDKQGYCQKERVEHFNRAAKAAAESGLKLHIQLYINNSSKKFYKEMVKLYRREAEFPYYIRNLGKMEYWADIENKDLKWMTVDEHGKQVPTESYKEFELVAMRHFDIYHLLAHIFNIGIETSVRLKHDYYAILSGDQLLPENHPAVMTRFLESHPNAGIAASLAFYDFSKKEIVDESGQKTYLIPLIIFRQRPDETEEMMKQRKAWIFANLLPYPENDYTGLEHCEVDALGTGGAVIPRSVFTRLRFRECVFVKGGEGEDIQYCLDIREKLGLKVYIVPTVVMENRYADGQRY